MQYNKRGLVYFVGHLTACKRRQCQRCQRRCRRQRRTITIINSIRKSTHLLCIILNEIFTFNQFSKADFLFYRTKKEKKKIGYNKRG